MRHLSGILLGLYIILCSIADIPALCQTTDLELPANRQVVISIKGMMCSSCGQEIEKSLRKVAGVRTIWVDVPNDRATVSYDERKVTPRQLAESIRKAGYEASLPTEAIPAAR